MINPILTSGTRPAQHIYKEKKYHEYFGGIALAQIPDFNLDPGLTMPNQNADNAETECVGYTGADQLTDIFKVPFDPDFSYAVALRTGGDPPGVNGASFHAGEQGLIWFGGLLKSLATISAAQQGEAFVSNLDNWPTINWRNESYKYKQNGLYNVLGFGDAFTSVLSAAYSNKLSVSIGSAWYPEFEEPDVNGIVKIPQNFQSVAGLPWHNYVVKGQKTMFGVKYAIVKSWQGTGIGDKGFLYFPMECINGVLSVIGSGALTINVNANHFLSLLGILSQRFPGLLSDLSVALRTQVQNTPV